MDAAPPERSPRVHRVRHLQDALPRSGSGERHGLVAFVGEGQSDRYGALYSDVVFAKDALVAICEQDGVAFLPWETFDDVRNALETLGSLPGPVELERCLGWTTP